MFRALDDFVKSWQQEAKLTLAVIAAVPDAEADRAVAEGHRTLKRLGWHLVESAIEMPSRWGLEVAGRHLMTEKGTISDPPATMGAVRDAYDKASASLLKGIAAWRDADLEKEDDMYGEVWKRGFSLMVLVAHQIHHRGQMTVLLRQAGAKVPEVYGPTKEGWAAYGAEPPRV